jgi:hypothetical protein
MGNPIVHWEICAKNSKKAVEFYSRLFDWKIEFDKNLDYWMCNVGPSGIGGGIFQAQGEMPSYVTIYIKVDDLQAALDKAVELGAFKIADPTPIPGVGSYAMFADPEGNAIGLLKMNE